MTAHRFLVVAGEASGDMYGAEVARALRRRFPDATIFGLGGQRMRDAGVELEGDISHTAVVGPFEAIGYFGELYRVFRRLAHRIDREPPSAAVLIDFPDFNLRLAPRLRKLNSPIIYYISPQVWAWRTGRIEQIRKLVTKMLVILPFEEELYRKAGVDAEFVGHPLIDLVRPTLSKEDFCDQFGIDPLKPLVALLPGSRKKEIRFILPTLCLAADLIRARKPDAQFVLPVAPGLQSRFVREFIGGRPIRLLTGSAYNAVKYARVAIVASGTATLETALLGTPEVIVYRISGATWLLGKFLLKVRMFGLVNIIMGEEIAPELFQDGMTPENVSRHALHLMEDVWAQSQMRRSFEVLRQRLGDGRVADKVAGAVARAISSERPQTTG